MRRHQFFHLALVFCLFLGSRLAAEEKFLLREAPLKGESSRVQLEVRGHLQVQQISDDPNDDESEVKKLPLAVDGELKYRQRLLPDEQGRRSAVRLYTENKVKVVVDDRLFQPALAEQRQLVRVDVEGEKVSFQSPHGPLSREELELVAIQGNSLLLHRLLPHRKVAMDETWMVDGIAAAPIFGLEESYSSNLQARLTGVEDQIAQIRLQGYIEGAVGGVSSRVNCEASLEFDLQREYIRRFDVSFDEKRDISGGQPGIDAHSHLRITIVPADPPQELQDGVLARFPKHNATELLQYRAPKGEYSLILAPRWRVITSTPKRTTLRLLEGGDVVAQGSLSKLANLPKGRQLTLEAFSEDVGTAMTNLKGQIVQAEQTRLESGLRMLRVTGLGKVQEVEVQWVYLHVSDDRGNRVSCVFTLEQKRVEAFQGMDVELLSALEFAPSTAQADKSRR